MPEITPTKPDPTGNPFPQEPIIPCVVDETEVSLPDPTTDEEPEEE